LVLIEFLPFIATKSHSNDMTASDSALPREEPPMFRFSIRDVLWLTVVVGLGVGWRVDYSNQRKENSALRAELEQTKIREGLELRQAQLEKAQTLVTINKLIESAAVPREVPGHHNRQIGEPRSAGTVEPTP
jgi:hypothetical protein